MCDEKNEWKQFFKFYHENFDNGVDQIGDATDLIYTTWSGLIGRV